MGTLAARALASSQRTPGSIDAITAGGKGRGGRQAGRDTPDTRLHHCQRLRLPLHHLLSLQLSGDSAYWLVHPVLPSPPPQHCTSACELSNLLSGSRSCSSRPDGTASIACSRQLALRSHHSRKTLDLAQPSFAQPSFPGSENTKKTKKNRLTPRLLQLVSITGCGRVLGRQ
jgi:hypothetical protein